jgi:hypothetical protein
MNSFLSGTYAAGTSSKRFGSDFSAAIQGSGARGNIGGMGSIRNRFDTTPGAPLRLFETGSGFHTEGSNRFAPPIHENEEGNNPRITVQGRRLMPMSALSLGGADIGAPVERQLAFVWRARPTAEENINVQLGSVNGSMPSFIQSMFGQTQTQTLAPMQQSVAVQAQPSLAADLCPINFALADLLRAWVEAAPELAIHVTEDMLIYGTQGLDEFYPAARLADMRARLPGFADYDGFSLDGVPRNTIAEDGTAPQYDDGITVGGPRSAVAAKVLTVAMTTRGPEMVNDYWNGEGVETGNYCYVILKKFDIDKYDHPTESVSKAVDANRQFLYDLSYKGPDTTRDGAKMRRVIQFPEVSAALPRHTKFWMPFQFCTVTSRYPIEREAARYVDELGRVQYGRILHVGNVLHPPASGIMRPRRAIEDLTPYMNNTHAKNGEPFELLLQPDDGYLCAY